ncbi:MAG: hydroxymethylbilane synthase [Bacteroidota bacterium]
MKKTKIIIGTRGSKLALWQANFTKTKLEALGVEVELKIIKTKGDKIQHLSFDKIEGKGFFTKELESALLMGEIDMAVHSMKDMPTTSAEGLVLTAVSYREDPADWLIIRKDRFVKGKLLGISDTAIVGTSSARRKAQMRDFKPDIQLKDIRGNVPTRLDKLRKGDFDAILLAAAGLTRLQMNLSEFEVIKLNPKEFVPAPAQGVLAYQTAKDDISTRRLLKNLHHSDVSLVTNVERKVLKIMEGGCHMPLGVYCEYDAVRKFKVWAAMAQTWESPVKFVHLASSTHFELAEKVVSALKDGASKSLHS